MDDVVAFNGASGSDEYEEVWEGELAYSGRDGTLLEQEVRYEESDRELVVEGLVVLFVE